MSLTTTYDPNPPGLPPIDLPKVEAPPRAPLRITVGSKKTESSPDGAWGAKLPEFKSAPTADAAKPETVDGAWGAALPDHSTEVEAAAKAPDRDVSATGAFANSATHGATFGLSPAISGVRAAGMEGLPPEINDAIKKHGHEPVLGALVSGLGRLGYEHLIAPALGIKTEGKASAAYDKARADAQADLDAGSAQHPYWSAAGELAGAAAVPVPGIAAANAGARVARGAAAGALGGAAYGGGSGISKGESGGEILQDMGIGGGLGAVTGGVFGGLLGPHTPVSTRGERAAETARDLGAPLPRGVASDSRAVQATTAKMRQVPFAGERIGHAVDNTQEAAGNRVNAIASHMTGGPTDRAAADAVVRPGLQQVIDHNRQWVDANYNGIRNAIDQNARFTLPRTQRAIAGVVQARTAAGHPNPNQGLEQFTNVAQGSTFNGAHRARVDAREAGNVLVPHPGYNAVDYNRITRAMTADLRDVVHAAARGGPPQKAQVLRAFEDAERVFGQIAEQNGRLQRIIRSNGEGAIATLLGASRERGGNLRLLAELHNTMDPADFHQIGGVLLTELGHNNATGQFSLSQFVTNWDKVTDRAKGILYSPQHLRNIEDIAEMGAHIKSALRETSSSHSASMLVFIDMAKDVALLAHDMTASGGIGGGAAIGAGTTAALWLFARWLGNPATASSMAAWTRARVGMLGHPTPARLAAFNIATRNLSNNLGVPVKQIMKSIAGPATGRSEEDQPK